MFSFELHRAASSSLLLVAGTRVLSGGPVFVSGTRVLGGRSMLVFNGTLGLRLGNVEIGCLRVSHSKIDDKQRLL
jgi:hypothetical protein